MSTDFRNFFHHAVDLQQTRLQRAKHRGTERERRMVEWSSPLARPVSVTADRRRRCIYRAIPTCAESQSTADARRHNVSPHGRRDDMPLAFDGSRRWQKSRRIYVRPRTSPQSAHLWRQAVAKLQAADVLIA